MMVQWIPTLRTFACYRHLRVTDTHLIRILVCYRHPLITDTFLQVFDFRLIVLAEMLHVAFLLHLAFVTLF